MIHRHPNHTYESMINECIHSTFINELITNLYLNVFKYMHSLMDVFIHGVYQVIVFGNGKD